GHDFQVIYSDTPGIIDPQYPLHKSMMRFVNASLEDADVILYVTDIYEKFENDDIISKIKRANVPVIMLLNKIDQAKGSQALDKMTYWKEHIQVQEMIPISALEGIGITEVFESIL